MIRALSDLHKLLGSAKAQLKATKEEKGTIYATDFHCYIQYLISNWVSGHEAVSEVAAKQVWLARKKIYFFAVFSNEFGDDLSPLYKLVDVEYGMGQHFFFVES